MPLSIRSNETRVLKFSLKPDGMIYGHVAVAPDAEDRSAGMPAEQYLPEDRAVRLQAVALKGNGLQREARYVEAENLNYYDYFLSNMDFCSKNYFHFFSLPAGAYAVTIRANGFQPKTKSYTVTPGQPASLRAIQLTPEP